MSTTTDLPVAAVYAPHTFTLICYRPNGTDTCRNCVMGRSDSDFELKVFDNPEGAADHWAAKLLEDKSSAREVCSWEITLLIDGRNRGEWYEDEEDGRGAELDAAADWVQVLVSSAEARALEAARVAKQKREAAEAQSRRVAEQHAAQAQLQQQRADYLRLKVQFEGKGARR
jgi:hypothetical protein